MVFPNENTKYFIENYKKMLSETILDLRNNNNKFEMNVSL